MCSYVSNVGLEGPVLSQPMNPLANLPFGGMATSASNAATGAMNGMLGGVMTRVKRSDPTEEQLECAAAKKEVCAYYSKSLTCTLCIDLSCNFLCHVWKQAHGDVQMVISSRMQSLVFVRPLLV